MAGGATPNNAKNFDLEDKIRFVELAPSMQIRLETIRSDIEQTWGSGYFGKTFNKYDVIGSSDTSDTKNAVTSNSKKNKIDQTYDSSTISADRDSTDTWNITGIWKNIEQIWGTPSSAHDHFASPPTGDTARGINPIWDKLDDHEERIKKLEEEVEQLKKDVAQLQQDTKDLKDDVDDLKDPSSGYTPPSISGGGSSGGVTWGNSSGGIGPIGGASGAGLIIQYGTLLTADNGPGQDHPGYHLTFPKPFTQEGYSIVGSDVGEAANINWSVGFTHKSLTSCDVLVRVGERMGGIVLVSWIAIGK